jgi:hypothetical protein
MEDEMVVKLQLHQIDVQPGQYLTLNKIQNFILSLASLSFIRRGIEGEVSQEHKLDEIFRQIFL